MIEIGNCTKLQFLDVSNNDFITDMSMSVIGTNCTELMALSISKCHNIHTVKVVSTQLESLYIRECHSICVVEIPLASNLLSLHIGKCNNIRMTEIRNCTNLQELHISGPGLRSAKFNILSHL